MRLLITRHAQTKHNETNTIQDGKSEISELGFTQIEKLISRLKKEKIDIIFSSDFERCKITAEKISKNYNLPIEYSELLREKNDGDWVGKSATEVNWDSLSGTFETRHAPNGESLLDVQSRGKKFYQKLLDIYSSTEKTILVISHGTFSRVFIGALIGLSIRDAIFNTVLENCSLTEIDVAEKYKNKVQLKYLNEKDFLSRE